MPSWTEEQLAGNPAVKRTLAAKLPKAAIPAPVVPAQGVLTPPHAPTGLESEKTPLNATEGDPFAGFTEMEKTWTVKVEPMGAPRMNRSDAWRGAPGCKIPRRPVVQRYFDVREVIRREVDLSDFESGVPDEMHSKFFFPMPKSWSNKKKAAMDGKPHRVKPDRDNCDKLVQDSLFEQDSAVWKGSQEKRWCFAGQERIELKLVWQIT